MVVFWQHCGQIWYHATMNTLHLDERIGVLGDVHGNPAFLHTMFAWFRRQGVRDVVQVGDFWYYTGRDLMKLERMTRKAGVRLYFMDGNHEDFRFLGAAVNRPSPTPLGERVTYLGRGTRGLIGETSFVAMGGAVSTDRMFRTAGTDWFSEETLTDEDVQHGKQGVPVDVLFSHDLAKDVHTANLSRDILDTSTTVDVAEYHLRMNTIFRYHAPSMVFHGHYHHHYVEEVETVYGTSHRVVGMGADISMRGAAVILNEDLDIEATYHRARYGRSS